MGWDQCAVGANGELKDAGDIDFGPDPGAPESNANVPGMCLLSAAVLSSTEKPELSGPSSRSRNKSQRLQDAIRADLEEPDQPTKRRKRKRRGGNGGKGKGKAGSDDDDSLYSGAGTESESDSGSEDDYIISHEEVAFRVSLLNFCLNFSVYFQLAESLPSKTIPKGTARSGKNTGKKPKPKKQKTLDSVTTAAADESSEIPTKTSTNTVCYYHSFILHSSVIKSISHRAYEIPYGCSSQT